MTAVLTAPQAPQTVPVDAILSFLDLLDEDDLLNDVQTVRRYLATARRQATAVAEVMSGPGPELREGQQLRAIQDLRVVHDRAASLARRLDRAYLETITVLARAVEARDSYTGGHAERVRQYSLQMAEALGIGGDALRQLEFGALLHDIGKIGVPDAILRKPGPLSGEECRTMRRHPEIGRRVLEGVTFLREALGAVACHHEHWDGTGYPAGLRGEAIPLFGRIVAVADAFDAMTTDRPYRTARAVEVARAEIERGRGVQFDPHIAAVFSSCLAESM